MAGVMALLASSGLPHIVVLKWILAVVGVNIVRLVLYFILRIKPIADPLFAMRTLTAATFVAGCVWSFLLLIYPNLALGNGPWLIIVVSAVCAGAVLRDSAEARVSIAFISPLLLVLSYKLLVSQVFAGNVCAFAAAYYLIYLIRSGLKNEASYLEALQVRNEMEDRAREAMLYQAAMKESPFGMLIISPEYRVIDANSAICRIFGCTREEILDDSFYKFTHPESVDETLESYQKLLQGKIEKATLETRHLRASGEVFWTYSERTFVRDPITGKPSYIVVQLEDIDQRKHDEMALKKSLAQEKLAIELADVGTCHYRPQTDTMVWSDRLYDIFQVGPNTCDTTSTSLLERIHPEDRGKLESLLEAPARIEHLDPGSHWISLRIIRPSGEMRYLRAMASRQGEPHKGMFSVLSVYRDVTDEHMAASQLAEGRGKLEKQLTLTRMTTEVSGLGTFEYDLESDRFTFDRWGAKH